MFRPATADDVEFILELLREFYRKDGGIYQIPFHAPSAILTIAEVLANGICLVGRSSAAGAIIKPFPWDHRIRLAHVVFWKFKHAREIKILDALANACRSVGATHLVAASLFPSNVIARHYSKNGFTLAETHAIKRL